MKSQFVYASFPSRISNRTRRKTDLTIALYYKYVLFKGNGTITV